MNKVEIVADSLSPQGHRITSMVVTLPRFLLAELNTHRALSRNSASSRAIRFESMLTSAMTKPFIPLEWQKDHPGMQGKELVDAVTALQAVNIWLQARNQMADYANCLNKNLGVTKQLANRLLEPFMYHTALITATEWENFFALRAHEHAEIHFQDIADRMLKAMNESQPVKLRAGMWHIPFGDKFKLNDLYAHLGLDTGSSLNEKEGEEITELMVKLATVRCARISYLNHGKETTINEDLVLHDRLAASGHWSAFEHCARVVNIARNADVWSGNFRGFEQYRKTFANENRKDSRLIDKV